MWYKKFLDVYEAPYSKVDERRVNECCGRIKSLQSNTPLASVVIIAYNESDRLFACLESVSYSKCKYPIEIIGVDNNSTDETSRIFQECGVKTYVEKKQGHGHARNCGLYNAKGKYYLCMDSDIIYPELYIEQMVAELERGECVAVNSRFGYIRDGFVSNMKMGVYERIRNIHYNIKAIKRPESIVRGAVFAFNIDLAKKVGGFRTNIKRGEDGSLALKLKEYGDIHFIKSGKYKAITGFRSLGGDSGVFKSLLIRVFKEMINVKYYFYKKTKEECVDSESNIIK